VAGASATCRFCGAPILSDAARCIQCGGEIARGV
jgi:hypothetical protein